MAIVMLRQLFGLKVCLTWMAELPIKCFAHNAPENPTTISTNPAYQFIQKKLQKRAAQSCFTSTSVPALNTLANSRLSIERARMAPFNRNANSTPNYYQLLGIPTGAKAKDIKAAYYLLAKQYHPDAKSKTDAKARKKFIEISEAYEVLGDDAKRLEYDRRGQMAGTKFGTMQHAPERRDTFHYSAEAQTNIINASTGKLDR